MNTVSSTWENERGFIKKGETFEGVVRDKPVVVFASIHAPTFSPEGMIKGLQANDYDVIDFDWQRVRFNETEIGMHHRFINKCRMEQPDFILLHMQNPDALTSEFVDELSAIAPTVSLTFDVRTKEGTEWLYEVSKHLDVSLFACKEDVNECKLRGVENAYVLQSSCDTDIYRNYQIKEKEGIVFMGGNYQNTNLNFELADERQDMIKFLHTNYGNQFKAYGNGQTLKSTNPQEEVNIYNRSAIAISHNNFSRELYTSDRLWRIMACGTFCLTKYFKGVETLFERGVHLDWWHNFDELKEKVGYYLSQPEEREAIAKAGSLFVRENNTWADRFGELKTILNKFKNG